MTLIELANEVIRLAKAKEQGYPLLQHETTRDRLTPARARDVRTHVKHIARAMGADGPGHVNAIDLTVENEETIGKKLVTFVGPTVQANTKSTYKLLRELAIELGVPVPVRPALVRPVKNLVYEEQEDGVHRKVARAAYVVNNEPYKLPFKNWPAHLAVEWKAQMVPFYQDPFHERFNGNQLADSTVALRLAYAERAFGVEVMLGVAPEDLSFRRLARVSTMREHHRYLSGRVDGRHTKYIESYLNHWKSVALNYFQDKAGSDEFYLYIRRFKWVKVKEKDTLPLRVTADDLYAVWYAMVAEAECYERDLARKRGRIHAPAQMGYYWHAAGAFGYTLVTLLRQENVAEATEENIYKLSDSTWEYSYPGDSMKGTRPKKDAVIDLWVGDQATVLLGHVLDKCVETRPHLIEKFRMQNRDAPAPTEFFLNMDGKGYADSTLRLMFTTAMIRYAGVEKAISQHDVRTIVPSWLVVREEGDEIKQTIQRVLDHANFKTTEDFYIKTQNIFGTRLAKERMDARARRRKAQDSLANLPEVLGALVIRAKDEIMAAHASSVSGHEGLVDAVAERVMQLMTSSGLAPTLDPASSRSIVNPA